MTKIEAIRAMLHNHKVQPADAIYKSSYWYLSVETKQFMAWNERTQESIPMDLNDMGDQIDWVIYEASKPKVKMWQWVILPKNQPGYAPFATDEFFTSEEALKKEYKDHEVLLRCDWSEIELEQ